MNLACTIRSNYFDQIASGFKHFEFRQFETITLTDDLGRTITLTVEGVERCGPDEDVEVRDRYPDVPWNDDLPIYKIGLGRIIRQTELITTCLLRELTNDCEEWEEMQGTGQCPGRCSDCPHLLIDVVAVAEVPK